MDFANTRTRDLAGLSHYLALVVLGDRRSSFALSCVLIGLLGQKHQKMALDFAAENLLGGLVIKVDNEREAVGGDELGDGLSIIEALGQIGAALVKLLEEHDGVRGDGVLAGDVAAAGGDTELIVVQASSHFLVDFGVVA